MRQKCSEIQVTLRGDADKVKETLQAIRELVKASKLENHMESKTHWWTKDKKTAEEKYSIEGRLRYYEQRAIRKSGSGKRDGDR